MQNKVLAYNRGPAVTGEPQSQTQDSPKWHLVQEVRLRMLVGVGGCH